MENVLPALLTKELAQAAVFVEETDGAFHGSSDHEKSDLNDQDTLDSENGSETKSEELKLQKKRPSSKQAGQTFKLRIALRSRSRTSTEDPTEEDSGEEREVEDDESQKPKNAKKRKHVKFEEEEKAVSETSPSKDSRKPKRAKRRGKSVKFEEEETAVPQPSPPKEDPEDESFLAKRAQNIKANKAMLAQLMADLQKMPGGAGLLKKQAAKQQRQKSERPPRGAGESRKNPERGARRQTRSMGPCESPDPQDTEIELSLEEELCEVRRAPRSRGAPRQCKPHIIRPVSDITEYELSQVADMSTVKVYNSSSGSTCHQCRQKTIDTKTCCRNEECRGIQGQFCGPCLRNRYGEDVKTALLDPEWHCPPCRGICNCSFCRAREGRCPTGILFPLAQYHGFSDVHSYLTSLRSKLKSEEAEEDS